MKSKTDLAFPGDTMEWQLNLPHLIERGITYFSKQEVVYRTYENETKRYTYADLYENACRFANVLKDFGIKAGDRVTSCENGIIEGFEVNFGIALASAVSNGANPRFSPRYVMEGINRMESRIVVIDQALVPLFEGIADQLETVEKWIIVPELVETKLEPAFSYKELIANADPDFNLDSVLDIDEREAVSASTTSGSTGEPKACVNSHRGVFLQALGQATTDGHGFSQNDVILHIVPPYHGYWLYNYTGWLLGMKQVFAGPTFDPGVVLTLIQEEGCTCSGGTPEVWNMVLTHRREQEKKGIHYDLSSLNRLFLAGTSPPLSLQRELASLGITPIHVFGMTEMHGPYGTSSRLKPYMNLSEEESFEHQKKQGIPLPMIQVRGVDDSGKRIPWDGEAVGELSIKGATILGEHYRMPEQTKKLWNDEGWFLSGDMINIDEEGYMEIVDRKKDLVKSGGEFISTIEMGARIFAHPKVLEAAVVGVPHPKWGERPIALIVPNEADKGSITDEEILRFIEADVPRYWLPDAILMVDEIPKTSVGKIDKSALKKRYKDYVLPDVPLYKKIGALNTNG